MNVVPVGISLPHNRLNLHLGAVIERNDTLDIDRLPLPKVYGDPRRRDVGPFLVLGAHEML